jgi:hypothetical protein
MKLDDFLSTVTPCCTTDCGSCAMAWLTRFCTLTWLMSVSVPGLKKTLIVRLPEDELADWKYSRLSTPLICASSGAATVLAMTSAVAPG